MIHFISRRPLFFLWLLFLQITLLSAAPKPAVVSEFFLEKNKQWQIFTDNNKVPGLSWHGRGQKPGFYFHTDGISYAYRPWEIGTKPFVFETELEFTDGHSADWRWTGVAVSVASEVPGKTNKDDIALAFSANKFGIMASVRQGGVFEYRKWRNMWRYERDATKRYVINQGGAGGHHYSAKWPINKLDGIRVRFKIERQADSTIHFTAYYLNANEMPWWEGTWQLKGTNASKPLRYVVVRTLSEPVSKKKPERGVRVPQNASVDFTKLSRKAKRWNLMGRLIRLQGRAKQGPNPPELTGYSANKPLTRGAGIKIHGKHFKKGAEVYVGQKACRSVTVHGTNLISAVLPDTPKDTGVELIVKNPNGLLGRYDRRLWPGRHLLKARPYEAKPAGGELFTLYGAGFEKDMTITINGKKAAIVKFIGPDAVKFKTPPGQAGPATIRARAGGKKYSGHPAFGYAPHPYLFFDKKDLAGLRKRINEPRFRHYKIAIFEKYKSKNKGKGGLPPFWRYLYTGKREDRKKAIERVESLVGRNNNLPSKRWGYPGHLKQKLNLTQFNTHRTLDIVKHYDLLFEALTPEQRAKVLDYLDRDLTFYKTAKNWWLGCGANHSNTVAVGNGIHGLVGLAVYHSRPKTAQRTYKKAVGMIKRYYRAIGPDGGCREGTLYWNYGLSHQIFFGHGLKNTLGDDFGLLNQDNLKKNVNFVRTHLGGDGRFFTFNDTQPWLTGPIVCADFGNRFDQPLMLWTADRTAQTVAESKTYPKEVTRFMPYAFLFRGEKAAAKTFSGVPTLAYLNDMNCGVMRNRGDIFVPELVLGIKGSGKVHTHHENQDHGSFVVHSRGEIFLTDPGYFNGGADCHSLPLIDGFGPRAKGGRPKPIAVIQNVKENGEWRVMAVDATPSYLGKVKRKIGRRKKVTVKNLVKRVKRTFVMCGDKFIVVLDDVLPGKGAKKGQVTSQYQLAHNAVVKKNGQGLLINGEKSAMYLETFGPKLSLSVRKRKIKKGWGWKYFGVTHFYTADGTYKAQELDPLVTVLVPLAKGKKALPRIRCVKRGNSITVEYARQKITFKKSAEGWESGL